MLDLKRNMKQTGQSKCSAIARVLRRDSDDVLRALDYEVVEKKRAWSSEHDVEKIGGRIHWIKKMPSTNRRGAIPCMKFQER